MITRISSADPAQRRVLRSIWESTDWAMTFDYGFSFLLTVYYYLLVFPLSIIAFLYCTSTNLNPSNFPTNSIPRVNFILTIVLSHKYWDSTIDILALAVYPALRCRYNSNFLTNWRVNYESVANFYIYFQKIGWFLN